MKNALLLLFFSVSNFVGHVKEGISNADRKLVVSEFQRTKQRFLADVKGLSAAQLHYKADTLRWSVAQCIEHIALAESMLWQWEQGVASQPATPEKAAEVKITDEQLLKGVVDRSQKFKAPEMLQPVGRFASSDAAIQAFVSRRDSTIAYLAATNDDLKNHFTTHPAFGTVNCFQLLLLVTSHSERHTLQIEEVKAGAGFPKK